MAGIRIALRMRRKREELLVMIVSSVKGGRKGQESKGLLVAHTPETEVVVSELRLEPVADCRTQVPWVGRIPPSSA